jgi:hypothetical protein
LCSIREVTGTPDLAGFESDRHLPVGLMYHETLRNTALHRCVLDAGKLLNEIPQLPANGMRGERDDVIVVSRIAM